MAERLDIHIALVAHPRKMPTDGQPRAPTGYDIAESAAFFNKPSLGVTVHQVQRQREDGSWEDQVELTVWKVRDVRLYGFTKGKVPCRYLPERMAFAACDTRVAARSKRGSVRRRAPRDSDRTGSDP